jgi:hypothetical protein
MQDSALGNLRMFKQLCGTNNPSSVILATTHWKMRKVWESLKKQAKQRLKSSEKRRISSVVLVERRSTVVKHDGSLESALRIVWDLA